MYLSVLLEKKNIVRKKSLKNGRDTGFLVTFIFSLCVTQNMGKTPVKNQYGKFLHINSTSGCIFMDFV